MHRQNRSTNRQLLSALGAIGLVCYGQAHGAEALESAEEASALQTVTVTAQKRAELARDVPAAVSAFSGKDLREGGGNLSAGAVITCARPVGQWPRPRPHTAPRRPCPIR